jgi:hypothetical protein
MALQKEFNYKGAVITAAYIKVLSVTVSKSELKCQIGYFADSKQQEALSVKTYLGELDAMFSYNLGGDNAIAQAYINLKTLSEFADAVDA